jgi:hypothetical protein
VSGVVTIVIFVEKWEHVMTALLNCAFRAAVDKFAVWRRRRRDLRDLAGLGQSEFSAIARDLRVSPDDLEAAAKNGSGNAANSARLLDALGIDSIGMLRAEPAVMRDMERVCALCPATARCGRDLRAGTSRWVYREYCPNRATIDALEDFQFSCRRGCRVTT